MLTKVQIEKAVKHYRQSFEHMKWVYDPDPDEVARRYKELLERVNKGKWRALRGREG